MENIFVITMVSLVLIARGGANRLLSQGTSPSRAYQRRERCREDLCCCGRCFGCSVLNK